jgi:hypothetical protein
VGVGPTVHLLANLLKRIENAVNPKGASLVHKTHCMPDDHVLLGTPQVKFGTPTQKKIPKLSRPHLSVVKLATGATLKCSLNRRTSQWGVSTSPAKGLYWSGATFLRGRGISRPSRCPTMRRRGRTHGSDVCRGYTVAICQEPQRQYKGTGPPQGVNRYRSLVMCN